MIRKRLMVLALALLALPASASTFVRMTPRELVADSYAVVQGKVLDTYTYWHETGKVPVTEAFVQVERTLVGEAPAVVTVRTFGGQIGSLRVEAHGFPVFQKGDRVVLFLENHEDGYTAVSGYQQGQFRVVINDKGIEMAIPASDPNARILTRDGREAEPVATTTLETLTHRIQNEARQLGRRIEN
jgi:hypothetical protein